ncbi:hypothetical protein POM88_004950 [Heracleum sosnowskyi]|uniref:Uncharacterized protein n=1 Tax=Heracleum sosnowskyi TaxID=360622 RepID=A0AAD8N869_9APIA|nr:hypothetical protein POM88_004950 [Heracleum sosnowskyi]
MANQGDLISVTGNSSVNEWQPAQVALLAHWPSDILKGGLANNPSKSYFSEPAMTDSRVDPAEINWPSATVEQLIHLLHVPYLRQHALSHLCQKRESCEELAVLLWHSSKGVSILVEEVKSTAWKLFSRSFTITEFTRACQAITLLQCLASQRETKLVFLTTKVTDALHLFLVDMNCEEHTLFLRNASLRVMAALLEADDPAVPHAIDHFLEKNLIALFLRSMEYGDLHSQWTATFIVSKILMHEEGLSYISTEAEPFFKVIRAYAAVVESMGNAPPIHLLDNIIQTYLRMLEVQRARDALQNHLPWKLWTPMFAEAVAHEAETAQKLQLLLCTISQIQWGGVAPSNDFLQALSSRHHMIA